jgi:hypothetical protein
MVLTSPAELAVFAALAASAVGCANLLGLDTGVAGEGVGSDAAEIEDDSSVQGRAADSSRAGADSTGSADATASVDATDAPDSTDRLDAIDAPERSAGDGCAHDDACGSCRAPLQPCQVGTECCSGICGASLTCL